MKQLEGVALASRCCCSSAVEFAHLLAGLASRFGTSTASLSEATSDLERLLEDLQVSDKLHASARMAAALMLSDLREMKRILQTNPDSIFVEKSLRNSQSKILENYKSLGIDLSYSAFEVVDSFPPPYSSLEFEAMSYDATDVELNGLSIGVCLKREHLKPFYSQTLLCHESVHACIGNVATHRLARGLEEGIAEVVGLLLVGDGILPWEVRRNIFSNSRLAVPQSQLWQSYLEGIRQVTAIWLSLGADYVHALLLQAHNDGRGVVKACEEQLMKGDLSSVCEMLKSSLSSANANESVDNRVEKLLVAVSTFPTSLVVSPLSFRVATHLSTGVHLSVVAEQAGVSLQEVEGAMDELSRRVFLAVASPDQRIVFDETKPLIEHGVLRYDIREAADALNCTL